MFSAYIFFACSTVSFNHSHSDFPFAAMQKGNVTADDLFSSADLH